MPHVPLTSPVNSHHAIPNLLAQPVPFRYAETLRSPAPFPVQLLRPCSGARHGVARPVSPLATMLLAPGQSFVRLDATFSRVKKSSGLTQVPLPSGRGSTFDISFSSVAHPVYPALLIFNGHHRCHASFSGHTSTTPCATAQGVCDARFMASSKVAASIIANPATGSEQDMK